MKTGDIVTAKSTKQWKGFPAIIEGNEYKVLAHKKCNFCNTDVIDVGVRNPAPAPYTRCSCGESLKPSRVWWQSPRNFEFPSVRVVLNDEYTAEIRGNLIKVGCTEIPVENIKKLYKAIKKQKG